MLASYGPTVKAVQEIDCFKLRFACAINHFYDSLCCLNCKVLEEIIRLG